MLTASSASRVAAPLLLNFADLNYRLMLPDADVRTLLADEQLREENLEVLRSFDQACSPGGSVCGGASPCSLTPAASS